MADLLKEILRQHLVAGGSGVAGVHIFLRRQIVQDLSTTALLLVG